MDVGLVCDSCSAFNKMGAKACSLCGDGLTLDPPKPIASTFDSDYTRPGIPLTQPSFVPCPTCGQDVILGHKFCGHCGGRMSVEPVDDPIAPPPAPPAPPAPPVQATPKPQPAATSGPTRGTRSTQFFSAMQALRAKLVVIKGDGMDGISFTLAGDEHLVGRYDTPILFEDDAFISPVHANFMYDAGNLVVHDEGSTNGIYIRIKGAIDIHDRTRFLVGEQVLEIRTAPDSLGPEAIEDGTYFFASPLHPTHFCIMQTLFGGSTGMIYHARKPTVNIGREGNDINFPDDPFISGQHAQISLQDNQLTLTDLDSKNGTFLRIEGQHTLKHGDYVFMGQQLLRVEIV